MESPYSTLLSLEAGFRLVRALRSNEHWAVYIALMKQEGCRFDKFVEHFGSNYHEMKMILDELEQGGLVEWFTVWDEEIGGDLARYYYRVTIDGYRFYFRICESLLPSRDIQRWNKVQDWTQDSLKRIRSQIDLEREATFLPKTTKRVQLKVRGVIHG